MNTREIREKFKYLSEDIQKKQSGGLTDEELSAYIGERFANMKEEFGEIKDVSPSELFEDIDDDNAPWIILIAWIFGFGIK